MTQRQRSRHRDSIIERSRHRRGCVCSHGQKACTKYPHLGVVPLEIVAAKRRKKAEARGGER